MDLQLVEAVLPFVLIGFLAQLVDGALGMAFGVITNTLLVSVLGLPPARASASACTTGGRVAISSGSAERIVTASLRRPTRARQTP